jgi:hypothetical protein
MPNLCETRRDSRNKFFISSGFATISPPCWCNDVTWNQSLQELMPDGKHFEEAFKRIMKQK